MGRNGARKGIRRLSGLCALLLAAAMAVALPPVTALASAGTASAASSGQSVTTTVRPTAAPTRPVTSRPTASATAAPTPQPTVAATTRPTAAASQTAGSTAVSGSQPAAGVSYPQALVVEHTAACAIVIETGRGRVLYAKDARASLDIPAASKIMTALLAVEKQSLDVKVTISNAVAELAYFESTGDNVRLRTGDKYSLEYLLMRLFFYDSSAAALAIAESAGNDEAGFVRQMNARANALGLKSTFFATASGLPPAAGSGTAQMTPRPSPTPALTTAAGSSQSGANAVAGTASTTVSDLAVLMQRALQNERFSRLFRKQSEYIVIDGRTLVPMANQLSSLWPYSEGRVSGVLLSGTDRFTTITAGTVNSFGIISITADGRREQAVDDTLALFDACQRTYEIHPLVTAGEPYTGAQETTRDGESFGLVYQQSVQYVRPKGDPYLKPGTAYKSYGPYSRPIQRSMTVGQVVFELADGTLIPVNVGPDRQILSNISLLNRLLNVLQANRNLNYLLTGSLVLLLLILLGRLSLLLLRVYDRRRR